MQTLEQQLAAIDMRTDQAEYDRIDALIDARDARSGDDAPIDMATLTGGREVKVYRVAA